MPTINTLKKLKETLLSSTEEFSSIGLITHINPDGDGLCCCLALQELLISQYPQKKQQINIILEENAPAHLSFLEAEARTLIYDDSLIYDLVIVLDCQSYERVGICAPLLLKAKRIIAIDHHESNSVERGVQSLKKDSFLYNDPYSVSVGDILLRALSKEFNSLPQASKLYAATNIYVTILNDTNKFTNCNTTHKVFRTCTKLMVMGVNACETGNNFLSTHSPSYYRFLGQTLSTITTYNNGQILFFHTDKKMLEDNNLTKDATNKMTDNIKGLPDTVKVTVYFREVEKDRYRLSLRSNIINVNKIAAVFGGGGHLRASGCEIQGSLEHAKQQILKLIDKELSKSWKGGRVKR